MERPVCPCVDWPVHLALPWNTEGVPYRPVRLAQKQLTKTVLNE